MLIWGNWRVFSFHISPSSQDYFLKKAQHVWSKSTGKYERRWERKLKRKKCHFRAKTELVVARKEIITVKNQISNVELRLGHSVQSNSLWPLGLQPARLLYPWNSLVKNTRVGSHSLLQGVCLTQGSIPSLLHCRQVLYRLSHQGSPSKEVIQKIMDVGLPWCLSRKESSCQCRSRGFDPWPGRIPQAVEQLSPYTTTIEPVL